MILKSNYHFYMTCSVKGNTTDAETRCIHYNSLLDVIAIKFKCCGTYYSCYFCHAEESGHEAEVWNRNEFETRAILCGICSTEMTINQYRSSGHKCPFCKAAFNPKCVNHDHLYFEQ